jgi:RNA polymerase sigma-70 factor (ECF subfamily)
MIKSSGKLAFELKAERELIAKVQEGDADAFHLLYLSYESYVAGQCRRLGCRWEVIEDVTQDVFIHLWKTIGQFKGHSAFKTWLHRVTENVVFGYFRKNKRHSYFQANNFGSPSEDQDPAERVAVPCVQEDRIWISEILSSLSPHDQMILRLFTSGYKHPEIAHLLGLKTSTCKSQLFRARLKIQKSLRVFHQKPEHEISQAG